MLQKSQYVTPNNVHSLTSDKYAGMKFEYLAQNKSMYQLFRSIGLNTVFLLIKNNEIVKEYDEFNKAWLDFAYRSTESVTSEPKRIFKTNLE